MQSSALSPRFSRTRNQVRQFSPNIRRRIVRRFPFGVLYVIALVGAMLIYGAFNPPARPLILTVTGLSKLIFIGLVLAHGSRYLGQQAGLAIAIDLVMVVLFIGYLIGVRRGQTPA